MTVTWQLQALGAAGILLVVVGLGFTAHGALGHDTWLTRNYRKYTAHLDRSLRLLFAKGSGERIVAAQVLSMAVFFAVAVFLESP